MSELPPETGNRVVSKREFYEEKGLQPHSTEGGCGCLISIAGGLAIGAAIALGAAKLEQLFTKPSSATTPPPSSTSLQQR